MSTAPLTVVIASPLEAEHVATLRDGAPAGVDIRYAPELLPPMRYDADHDGPPDWQRTPEQQAQWAAMLTEADALWDLDRRARVHPHRYAPRLRWMGLTSAGVGQAIKRIGIRPEDGLIITTASGVHAGPLTEFAIYGILHFVKEGPHLAQEKAAKRWNRLATDELAEHTLVVIGPGKIGSRVARVAHAFGMHTIAVGTGRQYPDFDVSVGHEGLADAVRAADAVVLAAPHTDETENIFSAEIIALLKPTAVVVNIGRGQLVDEAALTDALVNRRIRGRPSMSSAQSHCPPIHPCGPSITSSSTRTARVPPVPRTAA